MDDPTKTDNPPEPTEATTGAEPASGEPAVAGQAADSKPPTPDQVNDFVNDKSDDAVKKLVDRLLSHPRAKAATAPATQKASVDDQRLAFVADQLIVARSTHAGPVTIDDDAWIGDHCMAAEAVPGILVTNRKTAISNPRLKDLTVMNTTDSEFWGYVKDKYTTLPETHDRVLATRVSGRWRFNWAGDEAAMPVWEESYAQVGGHLLTAFAETYSLSLQQSLYGMGARVIERCEEIDEVRLSLPNQHHFLVDLKPFGLKNDNEVYFAADRPYGLIEATVLRDGCEARIPVDLSNL